MVGGPAAARHDVGVRLEGSGNSLVVSMCLGGRGVWSAPGVAGGRWDVRDLDGDDLVPVCACGLEIE